MPALLMALGSHPAEEHVPTRRSGSWVLAFWQFLQFSSLPCGATWEDLPADLTVSDLADHVRMLEAKPTLRFASRNCAWLRDPQPAQTRRKRTVIKDRQHTKRIALLQETH